MSRSRALVAGLGLIVVAILAVWRPWQSSEPSSAPPALDDKEVAVLKGKPDVRDFTSSFDVLADDDRHGTLLLEGIVIDSAMVGVSGVTVTVNSNPPRTTVSGDDGTFSFDKMLERSYRVVGRGTAGATPSAITRLSNSSDPVTLHLRPSSAVEIKILSATERTPIAGATVEIRGALVERATSDDHGIARITSIPAGRYQVAGWTSGHATARSFLRVAGGTSTYKLEILLASGSNVSGRVTNSDGAGVDGARVLYASVSERFDRAHPRFDAVVSAADGSFQIPALPKGTWRLSARHQSLAPGSSEPVTLDGQSPVSGVEIRLEKGAVIAGHVKTVDGQPGAGALVRASKSSRGFRGERPRQVFADDAGAFELAGLASAEMQVVALHESAASETETVDTADESAARAVLLTLALAGRIAGRVIDSEGEPIEGAQVRLMPDFRAANLDRRQVRQDFRLRGFANERADADGRFEFRGLRDGAFRVSASPPGSQQRGRRGGGGTEATAGDLNVELVLEARGSIKGKVAFANGDPATGFTVSTGRRSAPVPFAEDDGSFALEDLEPRSYRLQLRGPSFDDKTAAEIEVVAGETADLGTITVKAGRRVSGRVTDSGGSPIENATVVVGRRVRGSGSSSASSNRRFGGGTKKTTTNENGEFSFTGVGETELAIVAEHPSKGRSKSVALPRTTESSLGLTISLEPPGSLGGTVTIGGRPADSMRVSAQSKTATSARFSVTTGEDGTFRFDVLAPDAYLVSAIEGGRGGSGAVSKSITITSGSTASVSLNFEEGGSTLVVEGSGPSGGLETGLVSVIEGTISAATVPELDAAIAAREEGSSARAMIRNGEPVSFDAMAAGEYSVCVVALPSEVGGRAVFEYVGREGPRLKVACVKATLASSGSKTISVPVVVPDFVPEPAE